MRKLFLLFIGLLLAGSLWAFDLNKLRPARDKKFQSKQAPAAAGVRGLDEPPGEEGNLDARDAESLAWLESQKTAEEDLNAFVLEGGLEP